MTAALSVVCLVVYVGGLTTAAAFDIVSLIIPNRVVVAVFGAAALGLLTASADPSVWGWHMGASFGVLTVGAILFFFGLWGAGDAKLLAAAALAGGIDGLPTLVLWTAVSGGVLAVVLLGLRRLPGSLKERWPARCRHLMEQNSGVPYGVAIAAGAIIALIGNQTPLTARFIIS